MDSLQNWGRLVPLGHKSPKTDQTRQNLAVHRGDLLHPAKFDDVISPSKAKPPNYPRVIAILALVLITNLLNAMGIGYSQFLA